MDVHQPRIAQLDTQTMTFTNYTKEDGLPNNQFYWNASYYSPQNNLLYFGTINGLVAFTPDIAKIKKQDAKVKLTSISVAGTWSILQQTEKLPAR